MAVKNVCIIGAGNIGSRHLQALALYPESLRIYIVDPFEPSLKTARTRMESVDGASRHTASFSADMEQLPRNIDMAIIATNSRERKKAIEDLLSRSQVKFVILEKFLFPIENDYYQVHDLFLQKNITAFVNHPRRMYGGYRLLLEELDGAYFQLYVSGFNWGLCCNAIHYIDLIAFLGGDLDALQIHTMGLSPDPVEAKRPGYIELNGMLTGSAGRCSYFCFTSADIETESPTTILIKTTAAAYVISEAEQAMAVFSSGGIGLTQRRFDAPLQSGLTHLALMDIAEKKTCELTPYAESMKAHLPLLRAFSAHLNCMGGETDSCPIT